MQLSRKHKVEINEKDSYVTIFGGKLTDCFNVGRELCDAVVKLGIRIPYPGFNWFGEPGSHTKKCFMQDAFLIGLDDYHLPIHLKSCLQDYGVDMVKLPFC